jgi:hypothetical protein
MCLSLVLTGGFGRLAVFFIRTGVQLMANCQCMKKEGWVIDDHVIEHACFGILGFWQKGACFSYSSLAIHFWFLEEKKSNE